MCYILCGLTKRAKSSCLPFASKVFPRPSVLSFSNVGVKMKATIYQCSDTVKHYPL